MSNINNYLAEVDWLYKSDKYSDVFDSVEFLCEIEKPCISIIVISWRYIEGIYENFRALHEQRKIRFELIFVNNGKDDEEFKSIIPFVDIYVKLNCNTGAYKARNIGSIFAKAPLMIFLEDDGIVDSNFVQAHLKAYKLYDIICLRGICKPITNNEYNKLATHYYYGDKPFPALLNLEGNMSVKCQFFREVGGWDDDIEFGHGGPEFAIRLFNKFPDFRKQIYYPEAVIFHDYVKSETHYKIKKQKQEQSLKRLRDKYSNWDAFHTSWRKYYNKTYLLTLNKWSIKLLFVKYNNFVFEECIKPCGRPIKRGFLKLFN